MGEEQPFINFKYEGGFTPYDYSQVTVNNNGLVNSKIKKRQDSEYSYSLKLSKDELNSIKALIELVDFYNLPEKTSMSRTCVGQQTLSINLNGKIRTLKFRYRPNLYPLTSELWKLINHAKISKEIKDGSAYGASCACSPNSAGDKVFSPQLLKQPLKKLIEGQPNGSNLQYALRALSDLTTAQEWHGYLYDLIGKSTQYKKEQLLQCIASYVTCIPKTHIETTCSILLINIRPELEQWEPNMSYDTICSAAHYWGEHRYKRAIPTLVKMLDGYSTKTSAVNALYLMGYEAIEPVEALLEKEDNDLTKSSLRIFSYMIGQYANVKGLPEHEKDKILKQLKETTVPKLRKLADRTKDYERKEFAEKVIREIEKGWPEYK